MNNVVSCQEVAQSLMGYAEEDFPDQRGEYEPLNELTLGFPVDNLGLKLSPSFVTEELVSSRKRIDDLFQKYSYYSKNLETYINISTNPSRELIDFKANFDRDVRVLTRGVNLYDSPSSGIETYQEIMTQIDINLEKKYLETHKVLEKFVLYKFQFTGTTCLSEGSWVGDAFVENLIIPTGSKTYTAVHTAKAPQYSSYTISATSTGNLGNFAYNFSIGNVLNVSVNAELSGNHYKGNASCVNISQSVIQAFAYTGDLIKNNQLFPVYGS